MKQFLIAVLFLAIVVCVHGSSHGEAPETSTMPQSDVTDLYAFRSYETGREAWTTLIANWNPRQTGYGGPNYFPLDDQFYYNIYIDNTGDGVADITYQFIFHHELANNGTGISLKVGPATLPIALKTASPISVGNNGGLNFLEFYRVNVITSTNSSFATVSGTGQNFFVKPFDYAGTKTFANYSTYAAQYYYTINIPGCATTGRVFVGQRQESFYINLGKIFDLVDFVPVDGASGFPNGITQNPLNNVLKYTNIVSTMLEVPSSCLVSSTGSVIGVWAASRSVRGNRQKARLGNPLVNELLIGLKDKDKFNRRRPTQDRRLLNYIRYPTFPAILSSLFLTQVNAALGTTYKTIAPTNFPRLDLITTFLTGIPGLNLLQDTPNRYVEMLRLNTATAVTIQANQNSYGVIAGDNAGYPNGRRPGDDVIDITLRVAMGVLCHLGLGVCNPTDAVVGTVPFIDGAPVSASNFQATWPYLNTPIAGSSDVYNTR